MSFTPREIVSELDRYIIGHQNAKRAVAVTLRNRWRRKQTPDHIRDEITPKNILMIGPTGVGKTEIARRLAKLVQAPFLKVEATKFTEVGYVGRDVDQIIRDLVEVAIGLVKEQKRTHLKARAEAEAENRILEALCGKDAGEATLTSFRKKLRDGMLDDKEIELSLSEASQPIGGIFELPSQPGQAFNFNDMLSKAMGSGRKKTLTLKVVDAWPKIIAEEGEKLLDQDAVIAEAIRLTENEAIVFIDEIDKVAARQDRGGADVSREGVQRDLLPLIEGTTVTTKYGTIKTDHILFIASGAFHIAKPSDLLPELQGRLPIRVELKGLEEADFVRILTETESNLIRQNQALMATENIALLFDDEAIALMAKIAAQVNQKVENIGARRLHTIIEKVMEELSFAATDRAGETVTITKQMVEATLSDLADNTDLSRFIL